MNRVTNAGSAFSFWLFGKPPLSLKEPISCLQLIGENHPFAFAETPDTARQTSAGTLSRAGNNRKINRFNFRDMINHN